MKKLKIATISLALVAFLLSFLNPIEAYARMDDDNKKIKKQFCVDSSGSLKGYGNTCVAGAGNCKANPCGEN